LAREHGIWIPALCWHPRVGKAGRCRACVVEVDGRALKESCALEIRDGMVVDTECERVQAARRMVVELLLSEGHHTCMACPANGDCELQEMAWKLGIERPAFEIEAAPTPRDASAPGIVRDPDRCIHCGRCVTACQHGVVNEVLDFGFRASHARVICDDDVPMGASSCVQCGECVQVCPVGALAFKQPLERRIRAFETESSRVTCPYCGVGCQIDLHTQGGRYAFALGHEHRFDEQPNKGMLCVKGRFGLDFVDSPERLRQPLIRRDGALVEASWDEALDLVATRLGAIKAEHGPDAIGFLASAKVTNEENYLLQRLARQVVGTHNIDHCARL
jgi:predicted molibdopterin-dependent oxidoreductase YjgC